MKEIPLDVMVVCVDGECGESSHIIIERNSQKVTHFVVKVGNLLESGRYLVPIDRVVRTTPKSIALDCTKKELAAMPPFTRMQFLNPITHQYEPLENFNDEAIASRSSYLMWSDASMLADTSMDVFSIPVEEELIPEGEMAVHRGASVEATDGHIGKVEEFLVDPKDSHITHLVLEKGHLWDKQELTIPMSAIARMDEEYIYLNIDKATVKSFTGKPRV